MDPVVLIRDFTFVAAPGQSYVTEWTRFDSEYEHANVHVHCQTLSPLSLLDGIGVSLETSFDTVEATAVGSTINVTAPASANQAVMQGLADKVRVKLTNNEVVTMLAILSVWLQPKSE